MLHIDLRKAVFHAARQTGCGPLKSAWYFLRTRNPLKDEPVDLLKVIRGIPMVSDYNEELPPADWA